MRYFIYVILILTIFSCDDCPPQPVTPKDCPLPPEFIFRYGDPILIDGFHRPIELSPDGTKLIYNEASYHRGYSILDISSLAITHLDSSMLILPKNTKLYVMSEIHWCPYDNSKFVAAAWFYVDTAGDGEQYLFRQHLIIFSIDGGYFEDITPKIFGPPGSSGNINILSWLPGSQKGNNQFLIGYQLEENGKRYFAIYSPETQELQEQENIGLQSFTKDWKYKYFRIVDSTKKIRHFINDNELVFRDIDSADMGYASFSPDGRYFAIEAFVYDKTKRYYESTSRLAEIWLVDVEKFMQNPVQPVPVKIINIKEKFCMFSFGGMHPMFTSNNTIAVSLFKNVERIFYYLHEIDLNGKYVRQLTSIP